MTKDDFVKLPLGLALGVLWDAHVNNDNLATMPSVKVPFPPKFDAAIYRKDGVSWASEYDVEGLRFWHDKKLQSSDPKYADKDAKAAKALSYWIAYRIADPTTPWTGERNHEIVTAKPPSAKPTVYPRDDRGSSSTRTAPKPAPNFDDDFPASYGGGAPSVDDPDSDIPFILDVTCEPQERWNRSTASRVVP